MDAAATRRLVATICLAAAAPSSLSAQIGAQAARGRLEGRAVARGGTVLEGVAVSIPGQEQAGEVTDSAGHFTLESVPPGRVEVRFSRIGYASESRIVIVQGGATSRLDVTLSEEAIELAPIDVSVSGRSIWLDTNGFYRRAERGFGRQYSRKDLEERQFLEVSDVVRELSGVIMQHDPYMANRVVALRTRMLRPGGAACALTVFVDGVRTLDPNLNQVPSDWILGMEVYLGAEAPAQYRLSGGCGVVLLWTKDGRR